jgi:hypothetical protein
MLGVMLAELKRAVSPIINSRGKACLALTNRTPANQEVPTGRNNLLMIDYAPLGLRSEGYNRFTGRCHCAIDLWLTAIFVFRKITPSIV